MKQLLLIAFSVLFTMGQLYGQRTISGTVTDSENEPLIGALVSVVDAENVATITDFDGRFEFDVPDGAEAIQISYLGYQTQVLELGPGDVYDVVMAEGDLALDEVIVVAYGEQTRRSLVSSVSTIDSRAIDNIPAVSPQEVLQGQTSGVQIVNSSGVLGAATNIRIRGVASINAGGQPLFVVDGVPLNDGSYSNALGAGTGLNPLLNMSMDDIESISVLKDAAAASLYGSRGSNGVVLITTKQGRSGTNNVTFRTSYGFGSPTETYDMTNSEEFLTILGAPVPEEVPFFDWQDAVVRDATSFRTSLSFDGGNESTTYYVGVSYSDEENYVLGNEMEKLSGRLNLNHRVSDQFRLGANMSVSRADMGRIYAENSTFAPLTSAYLQDPRVQAFNPDGSPTIPGFIPNIVAIYNLSVNEFISDRTTGNIFAEYVIPGIGNGEVTLRSDFGIDHLATSETFRNPEVISPGGYGYKRIIQDEKWLTTNTARYNTPIGDRSSLNFLAGQSFETSLLQSTAVEASGFAADDLRNVASGASPSITSATRTEWALASYFARFQYDIGNTYFFEASIRRDGSSRFGADNRWGNFWAVGAGWNMSREPFLAGSELFTDVRLRTSYGITGNDRIGNFGSRGLYGAGTASDYAGMPGLRPIQAENPDLRWEQTAQFDIGISARIADFMDLGISFWHKDTEDLLLDRPISQTSGFGVITENAGDMVNTGVDIDFNFDVFQNQDWNISIGGNISFADNEVKSLPNATEDEDGNKFVAGTASQRAVVGQSANEFYLIRYQGINPETGNAEWLDRDGNPTTSPVQADRVYVGSAIPDFVGGLNFNVGYQNFTLSGLFNFTYGNMVMIDDLRFTENPVSGFNKSTILLDAWEQPGDQAFAPAADSPTRNTFAQRSTLQLMDGSYMRLKTLTLNYSLPVRELGIDWMKGLNIYFRGNNLLTFKDSDFRGQDPEVSDSGTSNLVQGESFFVIPQRKMYTFGLNVTF